MSDIRGMNSEILTTRDFRIILKGSLSRQRCQAKTFTSILSLTAGLNFARTRDNVYNGKLDDSCESRACVGGVPVGCLLTCVKKPTSRDASLNASVVSIPF